MNTSLLCCLSIDLILSTLVYLLHTHTHTHIDTLIQRTEQIKGSYTKITVTYSDSRIVLASGARRANPGHNPKCYVSSIKEQGLVSMCEGVCVCESLKLLTDCLSCQLPLDMACTRYSWLLGKIFRNYFLY